MSNSAFTPTILQDFREASVSQSGIVNTTAQTFGGIKTYDPSVAFTPKSGFSTGYQLWKDTSSRLRLNFSGGLLFADDTDATTYASCTNTSAWTFGSSGFTGTHTINGKLQLGGTLTGTAQAWFQTGGTTAADIIADFRTGSNASAMQVLGNSTVLSPFFLSISGVSASNNGNENSTLTGVDGNGTYLVRISGNSDAGYSAVFTVMVTAGGINPFKIQGHATLSLYQVSGSTVGLTTSGVPITQTYSWFFTRIG